MKKKLYRSESNRYTSGLAGGIADYFEIDASLVRFILVFLELGTAGLLLIPYLIASIFIPTESDVK